MRKKKREIQILFFERVDLLIHCWFLMYMHGFGVINNGKREKYNVEKEIQEETILNEEIPVIFNRNHYTFLDA